MSTFLKKYRFILSSTLIAFLVFNCSKDDANADASTTIRLDFTKSLGGTKNDVAQSITKTTDGGYAILGHTQSTDGDITNKSNESFDYWLLKYDSNNNLEWQKTYGGSDDDRGNNIIQTLDGGYAIIGYSKSNDGNVANNNGAHDFWVCKLDISGTILWHKNYGFSGADIGYSIIQTNDGGFLLTGVLDVSASNGEGNSKNIASKTFKVQHAGGDYWAIKINALGEKQWSRFYGGSFTDTPYDLSLIHI